ncbi:putative protein disulfide-isomerase [Cyphellophora attinorum]|uniref:protein disulfide-isomerase n=1 Tax=Cyphellophora attinorum TaxID=1664694 RepID=A0A0N1P493_9EURO|nr:putative protein disulfide-isomerase [Phialophora attinorum]KPI45367.1 putative protein disulfide-isomerase [Phialophora attinorum]
MALKGGILTLLAFAGTLVHADGIYSKGSPVLQVNAKTYDSLIAQSNHTSILEFYAPWCGHCQNLKPAYEKAAKNLDGLAKVAAINCDDDSNKPFCGQMGVQGFPTLKIVKPGTKRGKPVVEDYQGPRTAKGIVDAVVDKIPNHVRKLQSSTFDEWLGDKSVTAKAVLFTEKGTTSALLRAVAIDFLGAIKVSQVRSKETDLVEKYGVTKFPSLVLIPGDEVEPVTYSGEMKKQPIVDFLSQAASPNKDTVSEKAKPKPSKSKDPKKSASAKSAFSKASEAHMSADLEDELGASTIILDDSTPTESPLPIVEDSKPAVVEDIPPIASLTTPAELIEAALGPKKGTCILVLLPPATEGSLSEDAASALNFFAQSADKHQKRHDSVFPFYSVPAENEQAKVLRKDLGLKESELEIVALNNKRGWWRHFEAKSASTTDLETFIDNIKLGEGSKLKLPANFGTGPSAEDQGHSEL